MLARRIIPCLDVKDGRVVKGINFVGLRDAGDPVECAARYSDGGADEICFLDITATHDGRRTLFEMVERTAPLDRGPAHRGAVACASAVTCRTCCTRGADKVSTNSRRRRQPELCGRGRARAYGSQAIVVAIDAKRVSLPGEPARFSVFTHGGRRGHRARRDRVGQARGRPWSR